MYTPAQTMVEIFSGGDFLFTTLYLIKLNDSYEFDCKFYIQKQNMMLVYYSIENNKKNPIQNNENFL